MASTIPLHSLLETHDQPFCIIDAALTIIAVNRAFESRFARNRADVIGKPCCQVTAETTPTSPCRHRKLFQDLEPYGILHSVTDDEGNHFNYRIRGFPLIGSDQAVYLGESILPVCAAADTIQDAMTGHTPAYVALRERLELAARSHAPVLLEGETGTGKELAARHIHSRSARKDRPLVTVDCTVLTTELCESELFGHEKGAFTGATGAKTGLFEMADQGTLFLDEIGELPLSLQPKLLRALEAGAFRRVGGSDMRRADVRIISATNRKLQDMVKAGTFREDLYYRIAVLPVFIPPLRERLGDIAVITQALLAQIETGMDTPLSVTPAAIQRLQGHAFPGNIRELRNILQLAATLAISGRIDAKHIVLANGRMNAVMMQDGPETGAPGLVRGPLQDMECAYITGLLEKHRGNRRLVADEMLVSERTLYRKLKRYQLNG